MGALENSGDGRIFINTYKGKFTKKVSADTTGAIKRTNKNNVEIYELQFNTISDCMLQKIEKYDNPDYGFQWNIYLAHTKSDETYKVSLPYSGRMTMGLFLRLPNIDISKAMTFIMYYFPDKNKVALVIYQNQVKIPVFWTEDNPGDLPQLVEFMKDGKQAWDSTARMVYLEKYLDASIHPYLKMEGAQPPPETATPKPSFPVQGQSQTVTQTPPPATTPLPQPPPVPATVPEWDSNGGYLKMLHTDGKWYQCDENGKFKRDDKGEMVGLLPF